MNDALLLSLVGEDKFAAAFMAGSLVALRQQELLCRVRVWSTTGIGALVLAFLVRAHRVMVKAYNLENPEQLWLQLISPVEVDKRDWLVEECIAPLLSFLQKNQEKSILWNRVRQPMEWTEPWAKGFEQHFAERSPLGDHLSMFPAHLEFRPFTPHFSNRPRTHLGFHSESEDCNDNDDYQSLTNRKVANRHHNPTAAAASASALTSGADHDSLIGGADVDPPCFLVNAMDPNSDQVICLTNDNRPPQLATLSVRFLPGISANISAASTLAAVALPDDFGAFALPESMHFDRPLASSLPIDAYGLQALNVYFMRCRFTGSAAYGPGFDATAMEDLLAPSGGVTARLILVDGYTYSRAFQQAPPAHRNAAKMALDTLVGPSDERKELLQAMFKQPIQMYDPVMEMDDGMGRNLRDLFKHLRSQNQRWEGADTLYIQEAGNLGYAMTYRWGTKGCANASEVGMLYSDTGDPFNIQATLLNGDVSISAVGSEGGGGGGADISYGEL